MNENIIDIIKDKIRFHNEVIEKQFYDAGITYVEENENGEPYAKDSKTLTRPKHFHKIAISVLENLLDEITGNAISSNDYSFGIPKYEKKQSTLDPSEYIGYDGTPSRDNNIGGW